MTNTDHVDIFEGLVHEAMSIGYEVQRVLNKYGYIEGYTLTQVGVHNEAPLVYTYMNDIAKELNILTKEYTYDLH